MLQGNICNQYLIKAVTNSNTRIEGYASVFGIVDHHNDIIMKGAFSSSAQKRIKLLWQHDILKPIGVIHKLAEDDFGLKIEAEINNKISAGMEASELIKQKAVDGLSIGFSIRASEYDTDGHRLISDIELFEVSVVTFPANQDAQIHQVKNMSESINNSYSRALIRLEQLSQDLIRNF